MNTPTNPTANPNDAAIRARLALHEAALLRAKHGQYSGTGK